MKKSLACLAVVAGLVLVGRAEPLPQPAGAAGNPMIAGPTKPASESDWGTSFEESKKAAAASGLPILADFSGSDWCGWCIKLDKEVFSDKIFKDYAKTNVVLFLADFPRRKPQSAEIKAQNRKLSETYQVEGFPTVLLLDATGKELARTGYQPGGAQKYVEHLKAFLKK